MAPPPEAGPRLALVVDEAPPDPADTLFSHMRALRLLGFSVVFRTFAEAADVPRRAAGQVRLAYLVGPRPMARLAAPLRAANPGVHVLHASADPAAAGAADAVVVDSPVAAARLERALPGVRAHVVPREVAPAPVAVPFVGRVAIGFFGRPDQPADDDAARVLLGEIMPAIWARAPLPCVVAGIGAPDWLRRKAGGLVRVIASPPDTAAFWRDVRVSVAPHRVGGGRPCPVLDSLAAGIPCVSSPAAAEGLALPPSLVAADLAGMVAALLRLYADQRENERLAAAGLAMLAACHAPEVVDRALAWAVMPG